MPRRRLFRYPPEPVVIRFRTPARKASAQLRKRRNSTRKVRRPQRATPESLRRTLNPVFRQRQSRSVQCTRNGSSCPPSRAALELATSRQESSNGGRISSRSSGTVRLPIVGNHPLSSRGLGHFLSHPADSFFIRFPLENVCKLQPFVELRLLSASRHIEMPLTWSSACWPIN